MSGNAVKFKEAIQRLAGTFDKDFVEILLCTVSDNSKAESDFIIDCTPISGDSTTPIPSVKLNAEANDGFLVIPAQDSTVLVATSTRNNYYVLMYSDIQKIICTIDANNYFEFSSVGFVWNGGNLGGMAKTTTLTTKYNNIETILNQVIAMKNAIAAAAVSSPGTPVTNSTLATFFTPVTPTLMTPTTQAEIEDNKIKH